MYVDDDDNILDRRLLTINKTKKNYYLLEGRVEKKLILIKLNTWSCLEIRIGDEIKI